MGNYKEFILTVQHIIVRSWVYTMSQVLNTITQQVKAEGKVLRSKTLCQNSSLIN